MRKACIVSVGNELLNGRTVDTNSNWLCGELARLGIPTEGIWISPDEVERVVDCLKEAAENGNIIIVTGGLGPTADDLTRQGLANFLGVELEFRQDLMELIQDFFKARKVLMAEINRTQAFIPKGSKPIPNDIGTAPGIHISYHGTQIFSLPGVPQEMKKMYSSYIYTLLSSEVSSSLVLTDRIHCYGAGESAIAQMLGERMRRGRNPLINCTVSGGDITLHIVATAETSDRAKKMIQEEKRQILDILKDIVYSVGDSTLPEVVGSMLKEQKMTLVTAESCTGGLVGKYFTDIPGSSIYYLGGWITYSNQAKSRDLEVSQELIRQYGAVSEPVAKAMAEGAMRKSGANCAIAITGIAGPDGGSELKPIGLVYIAIIVKDDVEVKEFRFSPLSRELIRQRAALSAINLLRLKMGI